MGGINKKELKRIFEEIKNGKQEAAQELYDKYKPLVYGVAFSIVKNKDDAEDITQNSFKKIIETEAENLPTNYEATWLYTVTKNEALIYIKKKKEIINIDDIYYIQDSEDEISKIIDKETYNKLISKLSNKEKKIISLKILSNLSFTEISELTGEKTGTVKWRYYNAIYRLKIVLSNITASIISAIIGLATFKKEEKMEVPPIEKNEVKDTYEGTENIVEEKTKSETKNQARDILSWDITNTVNEDEQIEKTVTIEELQETNYASYGFIAVSAVFLLISIIIIIIKSQLKFRKKHLNNRRMIIMKKHIEIILIILILCVIGAVVVLNTNKSDIIEQETSNAKQEQEEIKDNIKVSDVNLICEATHTDKLVRYNGILYGKSYAIICLAEMPEAVGVIDKIVDNEYLPLKDGQTNSEELLGAGVASPTNDSIILLYGNDAILYNAIDVEYNNSEVTIKNDAITNEILLDDFLAKVEKRENAKLVINNEEDKVVIEYFPGTSNSEDETYNLPNLASEEESNTVTQKIYGYYQITKNDGVPFLLDGLSYKIKRKTNAENLVDVNNGVVTIYAYNVFADVALDYEICKYSLSSSNYTRKFDLKYLRRKDMGVKKITNDEVDGEGYNINTLSGDVYINIDSAEYSLEEAIKQGVISKQDIYNKVIMDAKYGICDTSGGYRDGGSQEYLYPQVDKEHEAYTILKLNLLDDIVGRKDIFIGMPGSIINYVYNNIIFVW